MNKRSQDHQNKMHDNQAALNMLNELSEIENMRNRVKMNDKREKEKNVMFDNQSVYQSKVQLKESLKQQEIDAFKSYKDKIDTEDYKRQLEKKEREERIKRLINRTTNVTVEQQASKAELEIDRKVREAQEQREQFEKMLQDKKRDDQRRH